MKFKVYKMLLKIIMERINISVLKTGKEHQLQFPEDIQIVNKYMGKKSFSIIEI